MKLFYCLCLLMLTNSVYAEKIAIVGGGASGVVTAWLLETKHDVTLYEAQDKLGGHADTLNIKVNNEVAKIDAGAEFFNEKYYPHLMKILRLYHIPIKTFTLVTTFYRTDGRDLIILPPVHDKKVEWGAFRSINLARAITLKKVIDKGRYIINTHNTHITLEHFLGSLKLSHNFKDSFLYPLLGSAWGISPTEVKDLSAYNALKYIIEAKDADKYKWYEVAGGLNSYIKDMSKTLQNTSIKLNTPINKIEFINGQYQLTEANGKTAQYDKIVMAIDAETASKLLKNVAIDRSKILSNIHYYNTTIAIHGDPHFMPPHKKDWRVINIRFDGKNVASTMYKSWKSSTPIFKSWLTYDVHAKNHQSYGMPQPLYALANYRHAYTNVTYFKVQKSISRLQGKDNIWFAGVWTNDNDSHESAVSSAIYIANALAPNSDRLALIK